MTSTKLTFTGSHGTELAARLDLPDGQPLGFALFAHCFTCGKDIASASRISSALSESGLAVLRFDFTGLGHSAGEFASTGFSSNIEDLVHAADYLRENYAAPSLLIGHSLGGAAVLAAAHRVPEVQAVATLGSPADPEHVTKLMTSSRDEIDRTGVAEFVIGGRSFPVRKEFLDDIAAQPQFERISNLRKALLVLHSPLDEIVSVDNARQIFDAARHPKSFIAVDDADHLVTRQADAHYVASMIATWASRYALDGVETMAERAPEAPAEGFVRVTESDSGTYSQHVTAGRHVLTADEPAPIGDDTGPNPYDLLLASLGACTSMTVRMYAERKGLPLEQVSVSLRHSRIHAGDCENCETQHGKVDHIERVISLAGDLDEGQRRKLLEIADKCPVHRTLHSETIIATMESGQ